MPCDFDAIVIGGGPAGSFAAHGLARAGRRVLIIERRGPGIGKTCGHCLNARVFPMLRRAGLLARVQAVAEGETSRIILRFPRRGPFSLPLQSGDDGARGLVVPRHRVDDVLLRAAAGAGAEVLRPATASIWRTGDEQVIVECRADGARAGGALRRYSARMVIGADGLASGVARSLGLDRGASSWREGVRSTGLSLDLDLDVEASFERGQRQALDDLLPPDAIAMHVGERGYLGVVRSGRNGLHIGVLLHQRRARRRRSRAGGPLREIDDFLESFPDVHRALAPLLPKARVTQMHAAGPMPWRPRRVSAARAALVGDAAGYAEPFTGEGLSWAFESADLLVRAAIAQGDSIWSAGAAREYERAWKREIGARLRTCTLVAAMLRSRLARRGLRVALSAAPFAARAMAQRIWTQAPGAAGIEA